MDWRMTKVLKPCDNQVSAANVGRRSEMETVRIPAAGFDEIAQAGGIKLSLDTKAAIETALNSYIRHTSWDKNSRPSKETRRHSQSLLKHVDGLLDAFSDVNRKLRTDSTEYNRAIALSDQCLFHRAEVSPFEFDDQLLRIKKQLVSAGMESSKGGRPKNFSLSDFFCELEEIFLDAGGEPVGVTKHPIHGTRTSPFTDFVNAILRFAPDGIGPSSSAAVAAAWERQLLCRPPGERKPTAKPPGFGEGSAP
jgi:hypothetical protein